MSWRDHKGPAKFRGVAFHADTNERGGGRRTVTHEYPLRDEAFVEDLGRQARTFRVEGYVLGEDYLARRDALIAALEQAGPGELVHPYHGTRRVICTSFTVRDSSGEGGIARFSIDFAETKGKPTAPTAVADAAAKVKVSAKKARAAVGAEFLDKYQPGSLLGTVDNTLRSATLQINNALSPDTLGTQGVASMRRRLDALQSSVTRLLNTPGDLLVELESIFGSLDSDSAKSSYSYEAGPRPPETTPRRRLEAANFDAMRAVIRRFAVIRVAELAPDVGHDSFEAAVAERETITGMLDEQADSAGDDAYAALLQLRADLVQAIPGDGKGLARLLAFTPTTTVPSLVLAHRLYGDLSREADLVARNRVRHPGFVLGGRPLEVLSRG